MFDLLLEIFGREAFDRIFFFTITLMVLISAYIDFKALNFPPGPTGTPIFGYLPMLHRKTPYTTLKALASHYGKVFSISLGSVYTVVISDVKLIREALNLSSFHEKVPLLLANEVSKGKGILMADGERWKRSRFFIHSALHSLSSSVDGSPRTILENKIQISLAEFLQDLKRSTGYERNVRPSLRHSIGSLMVDVVTGIRPKIEDPKWGKMQAAFSKHLRIMSVTSSINFVPLLRKFSKFTNAVNALLMGKDVTESLYTEAQDKFRNTDSSRDFSRSIAEAYIAEAKRRGGTDETFSDDQVSQVLLDTIAMGWQTTMNSIQWIFVYLAMHPEVQENVIREIDCILGADRSNFSLDDCKKLAYTEAVIMEVWRHRPVLPMGIPHCAAEKTKIGNYCIREGTLVIPLIYAVHRDQRFWDKPDDFIPERHINDDGSIKKSDYFIPFQTGLRMCLGEDLAKWTVLLYLVGVISGFKISFPKGVNYNTDDLPDFCFASVPPPYGFVLESRT